MHKIIYPLNLSNCYFSHLTLENVRIQRIFVIPFSPIRPNPGIRDWRKRPGSRHAGIWDPGIAITNLKRSIIRSVV